MSFKQLLIFRLLSLLLYLEKNCEVILFRRLTLVSENTPKITSIGPPITEKRPFKKLKILSFLASFISKIKTVDIFDFLSFKYFGKGLLFLKFWLIRVNYCWNYRPSNLLFYFFRLHLGHLSNRQTKIAENWTIYFLKLTPKQVFGESFKFFDPPTTKWRSFKFFAKLNGNHILMANFSKFRKYKTFGLIELHNVSNGQLADIIFKLWKSCLYDYRVVEHTTFKQILLRILWKIFQVSK